VTLHLVGPAFDFPTTTPQTWCSKTAPFDEGVATKGQTDAAMGAWENQTEQHGPAATMDANIGWSTFVDEEPRCHYAVGGPAPLMITARGGISVTARPTPFLSLGARLDVQPLPLNAARGLPNAFPTGAVHNAAWTVIEPSRPAAFPVLIDLQARASVTF
jgi:hypothetical protein